MTKSVPGFDEPMAPADLPEDWTDKQNEIYSRMYAASINNQTIFTHPNMEELPVQYWETVCRNMAWIAAEAVVDEPSDLVFTSTDDGEVLGTIEFSTPGSLN